MTATEEYGRRDLSATVQPQSPGFRTRCHMASPGNFWPKAQAKTSRQNFRQSLSLPIFLAGPKRKRVWFRIIHCVRLQLEMIVERLA